MKLLFKVGETCLDNNEADALIKAAANTNEVVIDLADHVDFSKLDASKLFALSVESKNPKLASLAAKVAIEGFPQAKERKKRAPMVRITQLQQDKRIAISSDQAIMELCSQDSLKALGAAMILNSLHKSDKLTLRQIAVSTVNELAFRGEVSADSSCFRGFARDSDGNLKPILVKAGESKAEAYHASPVYVALREGLTQLGQWGMVETHETTEFGSKDRRLDGNSNLLRRVVYQVELTEEGKATAKLWNDVNDFIARGWSKRVRTRAQYSAAA